MICCLAVSLLILGGVFDRLSQYHEEQIRKSAIEELSGKTIKSVTYLLDNISKFLMTQGKTDESGNTALQTVNFFHELLGDSQVQNSAVQYVDLCYSAASPDSIFHLWASLCNYIGGFLLAASLGIMIIFYHQSSVNDIDLNGIDDMKRPTILILRQQAIALHRRSGLIMLLILASCIGGYWAVSTEMNSFFDKQRTFYRDLYADYSMDQSELMDLLRDSMEDQNDNHEHLMELLDDQFDAISDCYNDYLEELEACYDIDSDDIQSEIDNLDSAISDKTDELMDLYADEDFTVDGGGRQLYDNIKSYVSDATGNVKTFAAAERARQNKSYLREVGKMTGEVSNRLDNLKKQISNVETSDFKNSRMNDFQYISGENSISNSVKNGTEAMDNLYRTSLPNFVLFLRIAIMAIILAFVYFLLREYRYFSRKAAEMEMKIAVLCGADGKIVIPSAFIEFMMRDDCTSSDRKFLKSMKKYARGLKKRDVAKK